MELDQIDPVSPPGLDGPPAVVSDPAVPPGLIGAYAAAKTPMPELEKRASVIGLGIGGGIDAWKRMTVGVIWPEDIGFKDSPETGEEVDLTPEQEEARKVKARALALAKLMGEEVAPVEQPKLLSMIMEEDSSTVEVDTPSPPGLDSSGPPKY